MRKKQLLRTIEIAATVILTLLLVFPSAFVYGQKKDVWYVYDVIEPTVDQVKWSEEGAIAKPASWVEDGSWEYASMRESLVGINDIFVSTYERFNWSLVRSNAERYYGMSFSSFSDFENALNSYPSVWLSLSWQMDTEWYGINPNSTRVTTSFDAANSLAEVNTWFHITRVPEYLSGEDKITNWLTGFDLTPISIGSLKLWELYEDWSKTGIFYNLRFEAPAGLLQQHGTNYTCTLGVSLAYQNKAFKIQQGIEINMPANTVIKEVWPTEMNIQNTENTPNTASFLVSDGDYYPTSFTIISGSPTKDLGQAISEALSLWFLSPAGWAAIASLLVLSGTAFRGRIIWRRNKLYHRMYRSMVTLYDLYNRDLAKFRFEMDNISKSVFKMMADDKLTDDQFEKLLKRRDDLLERAEKIQPPPPPART